MERSLSLILNGEKNNLMPLNKTIFLQLETMDSKQLDEYVSKKFNSSEDVRKKYSSDINQFLEQNKELISSIEIKNNKKYKGNIVIIEINDDLMLERKKVIYKKDMILFNEIIKSKKFMLNLQTRDYINKQGASIRGEIYNPIFSEFLGKQLKFYSTTDSKYNKVIREWHKSIKDSSYYYDTIRRVLREYEKKYVELGLDSLDIIYSNYLSMLEKKKVDTVEQNNNLSDINPIYKEPKRYPKIYDEEGYPGDLEDGSVERHLNQDDDELFTYIDNEEDGNDRELTRIMVKRDYKL